MSNSLIIQERERRLALWGEINNRGGPDNIPPNLVKELRIHPGQQRVFRDKDNTRTLTPADTGVALSLRHTGTRYQDDLFEDGVIYHYPFTQRPERDRQDIESIKACATLSLPLLIVITPTLKASTRNIRLGWVTDHDDATGQFLIIFSDHLNLKSATNRDAPFVLVTDRVFRRTSVKSRSNQARFRFDVLKRYGASCAFCGISQLNLLEAAHICPVEQNGCDDPRNGIVLCLNHHRAFDAGLARINPITLEIKPAGSVSDLTAIGITALSIEHLKERPHQDALEWVWNTHQTR